MKHLGDIMKINGAEIEPYPIAVTKYRINEMQNEEENGIIRISHNR